MNNRQSHVLSVVGYFLLATTTLVYPRETLQAQEKAESAGKSREPTSQKESGSKTSKPKNPGRVATLDEVLNFARKAYSRIDAEINDYTCVLYKREYVDGEMQVWNTMNAKIRHRQMEGDVMKVPLSVYLRFQRPVRGRAVLYVENNYEGDLIARRGGTRSPNMTFRLDPLGSMAMEGNRYPITEIGFKNLAKRLIEVLEQELEYRDGELLVWDNARIKERDKVRECTHYQLTHHQRRPGLTYYRAAVTVDDELGIPIRYKAYDFSKEEGGEPQLLEEYAYTDVRLNIGLTEADFDVDHPDYKFDLHDIKNEAMIKK